MKHHSWKCLLAACFATHAMQGAEPPSIALYRGDASGAVSLTFDDGFREEVADAVAILDPLGIKGTFFLMPLLMETNPERFVSWESVKALIGSGHEIGTHGSIKEKLHEAEAERLDVLINRSHDLILENTGYDPVSYAAPGGSKVGEREANVIFEQHSFIRNSKHLPDVRIAGYGNTDRRHWSEEATRTLITREAEAHHWFIAYIHSIVGGYSPFKSRDEFQTHCDWLASQSDQIWIAPMGEVGQYVSLRENSKIEVLAQTDHSLRFRLVTTADESRALVPLTIVIPAAAQSASARSTDETDTIAVTLRKDKILLDLAPSETEISVHWE